MRQRVGPVVLDRAAKQCDCATQIVVSAMSENFRRHHHATRDVQIVFVEVPTAGSKKICDRAKPGRYPQQGREAWRPQRDIPRRSSKAERLVDLMNDLDRRTQDARSMLTPSAQGLREWLATANFG